MELEASAPAAGQHDAMGTITKARSSDLARNGGHRAPLPRRALPDRSARRRRDLVAVLLALLGGGGLARLAVGCTHTAPSEAAADVRIAKWRGDHHAAVSVTYDESDLLSPGQRRVHHALLDLGVPVDFELVTGWITQPEADRIRWLVARGFHFFGHGARHVNHDALDSDQVRWSATTCYDAMTRLGLKPVAFAYPGGHGDLPRTRAAVRDAGFLSARMFRAAARRDPYIVPDDVREPRDWYALPTLVMMGHAFDVNHHAVDDTAELVPYLDGAVRRTAWLIVTYHSIDEPHGYGFYPLAGVLADLQAIKARDIWVASINDMTLYVRERAAARVSYRWIERAGNRLALEVSVADGLPADVYDVPLTIVVRPPASWRGHRAEVRDPRKRTTVAQQEVPADGADVLLTVRPDDTTYAIKVQRD
jgi:peptidoglycan/xylan/chitin deacetylase (PgdA/CDA1 family)